MDHHIQSFTKSSLSYFNYIPNMSASHTSITPSGPSQNCHNGFLTNCPLLSLALSNWFIINLILILLAYTLQQLLTTLMVKSEVPDTPSKALIYSYTPFPVFFHTTISLSLTPVQPSWSSFNSSYLPTLLLQGDTYPHLTRSVSVRSQLKCRLLTEALPD